MKLTKLSELDELKPSFLCLEIREYISEKHSVASKCVMEK